MKKKDVLEFIDSQKLFASIRGTKLVYAIQRNTSKLKCLYNDIKKMGEPGEEFKPYLQAQWKLFEMYGEKLPSGELRVTQDEGKFNVAIKEDSIDEFKSELKKLEIKFKEKIKRYNTFNENYQNFLSEDIEKEDIERLHLVSFEDLPSDLTYKQLQLLDFMITE